MPTLLQSRINNLKGLKVFRALRSPDCNSSFLAEFVFEILLQPKVGKAGVQQFAGLQFLQIPLAAVAPGSVF